MWYGRGRSFLSQERLKIRLQDGSMSYIFITICDECSEFMLCVTQIAWSLEKYLLNFRSALAQGDGQSSHRLLTVTLLARVLQPWCEWECMTASLYLLTRTEGQHNVSGSLNLSVFRFHAVVFHYVTCELSFMSSYFECFYDMNN